MELENPLSALGDFVYLDYNATTPTDPRVAAAMQPFLSGFFGNPSSRHRLGRQAREAVEEARQQIAGCLGAAPDEILLTSGGSESDNLAIRGAVAAAGGGHVVVSAVEHPAVLEVVRALEKKGAIRLTVVGVDRDGQVDAEAVERELTGETVLVSLMLANNEVGTLQPVAEVAAACRRRGVVCHTDAAQAVCKHPVDVNELGVDLLTVAGHKLYAPKGIGALYLRRGVEIEPLIRGAGHERGLRAGTENVLETVGLGEACRLVAEEIADEPARLARLRDRLRDLLVAGHPETIENGHRERRLANTLSVSFPGIDAGQLLDRLADQVAASAGAACHGGGVTMSHVLAAMGAQPHNAMGTVRFSVGRFTTDREIERGAAAVLDTLQRPA